MNHIFRWQRSSLLLMVCTTFIVPSICVSRARANRKCSKSTGFRPDSRAHRHGTGYDDAPMLLARKKRVLALLLAVLNAMIAENAMSARRARGARERRLHLRFHIECTAKLPEETRDRKYLYQDSPGARSRQASVSTITQVQARTNDMPVACVSNTVRAGKPDARLSNARVLIERAMHHRPLPLYFIALERRRSENREKRRVDGSRARLQLATSRRAAIMRYK